MFSKICPITVFELDKTPSVYVKTPIVLTLGLP